MSGYVRPSEGIMLTVCEGIMLTVLCEGMCDNCSCDSMYVDCACESVYERQQKRTISSLMPRMFTILDHILTSMMRCLPGGEREGERVIFRSLRVSQVFSLIDKNTSFSTPLYPLFLPLFLNFLSFPAYSWAAMSKASRGKLKLPFIF